MEKNLFEKGIEYVSKGYYKTLIIFFITFGSYAQGNRQITIDLSPVVVENGKYYYDGTRVSFEDLMIPLISLHDDKIKHKIKVLNTTKDAVKIIFSIPLILVLINGTNQQQGSIYYSNKAIIWTTVGLAVISSVSISIIKRSIINRYNDVILQPTARLSPYGFTAGFLIRF